MKKALIFLETGKKNTPEYVFMQTLLELLFGQQYSSEFEIITVNGKDNLENAKNKFIENTIEGGRNLLIFDADNIGIDNGGFKKRTQFLEEKRDKLGVEFDLFLFPNNYDDGDFETLLERIVRKEKHKPFFDCFESYEKCIERHHDEDGNQLYNTPNRKGKLHTFITSVPLANKDKKKLGLGNWLFTNYEFWDINSFELDKLKKFIKG